MATPSSTTNTGSPLPSQVSPGGPIAPPAPAPVTPINSVDTSSFTPAQLSAFNAAKSLIPTSNPGGGPAPSIPVAQTSAGTKPVTVPTPPPAPMSLQDQITALQSGPNAAVTADKGTVSDTLDQIKALLEQEGTRGTETTSLQNAAGIPGMEQSAADIQKQITDLTTSAQQASLAANNRMAPEFAINGEQAQIGRSLSAQTLGLSAALSAISGNEKIAQDKVNAAISAEFDPLANEVDYYKTLLASNQDSLSADEKAQSDQITQLLNQRADEIKANATAKADVYNIALEAAKNGAPASAISKINATTTGADAIKAAGAYLKTTTKPTIADSKQSVLDSLSQIVTTNYGGKPLPNGKPVVDQNGFITPEALQYFISQAPSEGLTAADVVTSLQPYIYSENGVVSPNYKLNVALSKLVNAAPAS